MHGSNAWTHVKTKGSQYSPALQSVGSLQETPGLVGFTQLNIVGLQYAPGSLHGDSHVSAWVAQIFVIGSHTWPWAQASLAQLCFEGARQLLVPGEQYWKFWQAALPSGGLQGSSSLEHSLVMIEHVSPLSQPPESAQWVPGLVVWRQCLRPPPQ
mmetsp:Transcript_34864/g.69558  ORF Transcript_34864/g.69558 Transcript_34864/m.69558 type:complete len:155 (-) Transcript_34864:273-737(-)